MFSCLQVLNLVAYYKCKEALAYSALLVHEGCRAEFLVFNGMCTL